MMTDTSLLNAINNHLDGASLKIYKQDGQWTVRASYAYHDIEATRPKLRDSLNVLMTNLKGVKA